jgi:hypothetical protein
MSTLLEKLQELVQQEVQKQVQKQLNRYAEIISKKHDISLKLLIQDIPSKYNQTEEDSEIEECTSGQCMGITAKKKRCAFAGKHGGYCARHKSQKKAVVKKVDSSSDVVNQHVGHKITECMYLVGCPACEKSRGSRQNLLIEI